MRMWHFALVMFLIFMTLFSLSVNAYTMFSYNPYFSTDSDGILLYSNLNETSIAFSRNSSWAGASDGVLNVTDYGTDLRRMYIFPASQSIFPLTQGSFPEGIGYNNTTFFYVHTASYNIFTLPKNSEGILIISYEFQDSPSTCTGGSVPSLQVQTVSANDPNVFAPFYSKILNTSTGIFYNHSVIINATSNDRYFRIFFDICDDPQYPSANFTFLIDKFKFYTFDLNEYRTSWTGNQQAELERYCGANSTTGNATSLCPAVASVGGQADFASFSNGNAFMLGKDNEGYYCDAFKLGNISIARRAIALDAFAYDHLSCQGLCRYMLHKLDDGSFFYRDSAGGGTPPCIMTNDISFYEEAHSLTAAKITVFNGALTNKYDPPEKYNNTPPTLIGWYKTVDDLINNTITRGTVTLNYTGSAPAGALWHIGLSCGTTTPWTCVYASAWYPFFSVNTITFTAGWSCDPNTNYEQYIDSQGNQIYYNYCGDFGCNETTGRCTMCDAGWFCDSNQEYFYTSLCAITNVTSCGLCGCGVSRCNPSSDHWECNTPYEAYHYNSSCISDLQLLCGAGCDDNTGQCFSEINCVHDSDCYDFCQNDTYYSGEYCNTTTYTCSWSDSEVCVHGCVANGCRGEVTSPLFGTNETSTLTPTGMMTSIYNGVLGFVNAMGGSLLGIVFMVGAVLVIFAIITAGFKYLKEKI